MSRRAQKKISVDGAAGELETGAFDALDRLSRQIDRQQGTPEIKAGKQGSPRKASGRVEIRREKAGRGGKTVTTLRNLPNNIPLKTLEAMAFDLKKQCACGGTLKGRVIELQGDVCQQVSQILKEQGYKPVRAGG